MRTTFTMPPLLCWLLLLATTLEARKDPREYWRSVMKDQPMPEAIEGLVHTDSGAVPVQPNVESDFKGVQVVQDFNHKCKQTMGTHDHVKPSVHFRDRRVARSFGDELVRTTKNNFVKDLEPRPNVSSYGEKDVKSKGKQSFANGFEPRPNLSAYGHDEAKSKEKQSFANDFEPRPNVSAYGDDEAKSKEKQSFANDFEPRPNVSAYGNDDIKLKEERSFVDDFEPRPNVSAHGDNDVKSQEKQESHGAAFKVRSDMTNNFEPRPNLSVYEE